MRRHDGGLLIAFGAGFGFLVAVYNYFSPVALLSPTSDIAGTPGALVAIAATAILCIAGLVLAGTALGPFGAGLLLIATLFGIVGTAVAGWLLESKVLVALMAPCLVGWVLRVATRRPAYA